MPRPHSNLNLKHAKVKRRVAETSPPVLMLYNLDRNWSATAIDEAVRETEKLARAMRRFKHKVNIIQVTNADLPTLLKPYNPSDWILFNWCEELPGVKHSEAKAARMIDELGFTYTGAAPEALIANWSKPLTKKMLASANVPVPRWKCYENSATSSWNTFPAIVKLANEHCSMGVTAKSVVMNQTELKQRTRYVIKKHQQPALVEDFIDGREFHVTLWGNGTIEMLPPVEMDFSRLKRLQDRLCTQSAKFDPDSMHYRKIVTHFKPKLTADELAGLKNAVAEAYRVTGCRDYARIDVRLRDGVFYVLDVNPNTDLTSEASTACAAAQAGFSYGAMGSRIVSFAAQRHPRFRTGSASRTGMLH